MSQQSEQATADAEESVSSMSVADRFEALYHLPALAVMMVFMLWVRLQAYGSFTRGDQVLFSGNDAYYHFRQVSYTVRNWPFTMPYDPWTSFPYGTSVGQFGTLFDQIVATAALVVGLGSPSARQIAVVTLVAPAVFGAFVAVPVYFAGERLHSRPAGLFGVLVLALLPGTFLRRSTVGFADHHVAESLFMMTGVVAMMAALGAAEREDPVYEQLLDRDWDGLREPAKWAALAGVAVSLYLWVWPPGIVLIGILGAFFAIAVPLEYARGRRPDHLAFVAGVSMGVQGLFNLVRLETLSFSVTVPSIVHVVMAFGVAVGAVVLAALARLWDERDVDRRAFPAAVLGLVLVGAGFASLVLSSLFDYLVSQGLRAFGFGQSASTLTIAEAQPSPGVSPLELGTLNSFLYQQYGMTYLVAFFGLCWLLAHLYFSDDYRAELLLVGVVTAFVVMMALTQVRFHYYLAPIVAVLNAWAFGQVIEISGVPSLTDRLGDVQGYQVLTLLAVFMLVVAPLAPPLAAGSAQASSQQGLPQWVVDAGSNTGPSGSVWADSGTWMENNTPEPGTYYGGGNEAMPYYGTYGQTQDYEYPEGAYGVMSWWDYGHWITVTGERIPHANPFQENARSASSFLQADSEERATLILEAIPSLRGQLGEIDNMTNAELRAVVDNQSDQQASEDIRYVMIDDQTATTKFGAVTQWANPPGSNYFSQGVYQSATRNGTLNTVTGRYDRAMVSRLYRDDARGLEHFRLVHEAGRYTLVGGVTNSQLDQSVPLTTARQYGLVFNSWTPIVRNISLRAQQLERSNRVFPLSQISRRLRGLSMYDAEVESLVKTYEYVPGATVTGQVNISDPTNRSPVVLLNLQTDTGRTFQYSQRVALDEQGQFNVTVPYATDNSVTPADGGTNESVRAVGNYSLYSNRFAAQLGAPPLAQFDVPETRIYEGATVELGTVEPPTPPSQGGNETGGNETGGNESGGNESGGNETGGNETGSLTAPGIAAGPTAAGSGSLAPAPDGLAAPSPAARPGAGT